MHDKLRQAIDRMFQGAPQTVRTVELKEELLQNLTDKYNDLIAEGKTQEAAYNIAVASIGDVRELIGGATAPSPADDKALGRRAVLQAAAIVLYVLCVIPCVILQNEVGVVVMFMMIAAATGALIYLDATKTRYQKTDDTMVEDFKAWKQENSQLRQAEKAIIGSVWLVTVCAYFVLSLYTGAWHITWLVYLIAAAVCQIIRGICMLKATEDKNQ